jgi:hypothetical protein
MLQTGMLSWPLVSCLSSIHSSKFNFFLHAKLIHLVQIAVQPDLLIITQAQSSVSCFRTKAMLCSSTHAISCAHPHAHYLFRRNCDYSKTTPVWLPMQREESRVTRCYYPCSCSRTSRSKLMCACPPKSWTELRLRYRMWIQKMDLSHVAVTVLRAREGLPVLPCLVLFTNVCS